MVPGQATVSTIDMSPLTSDVTVPATTRWEAGDLVPFTLHFEHSGRAEAPAVVVQRGTGYKGTR